MTEHRRSGFTLMEIAAVVIVIGVAAAFGAPSVASWLSNQRFKGAVREASGLLTYARGQALRTGNVHIVFFETDAQSNALVDGGGNPVFALALDDGRPGTINQNCKIDTGEDIRTVSAPDNTTFGLTLATGRVGGDGGAGDHSDGWSFEDPDGNDSQWVLFRGQGTPFSFAPDCDLGDVGSGAGGIYVTNGKRDVAIVVTALGAVRMHGWNQTGGVWTN